MFLLLHLLTLTVSTDASSTSTEKPMYTIVAPSTMFSRATYTVQVFIHYSKQPVDVKVELQKPIGNHSAAHTFEPLESVIKSGEGKTFRFKTKHLSRDVYELIVIGRKGIEFEERASIPVNQKSATFLIQTDKGVYLAGQTVKFRVFTLDSNLLPVVPIVNIIIYDGNLNRIEQYLNQQVQGVYLNEFKLANRTICGDWKIVVEEEDSAPTSLSFTVKEYTVPTFEVTVKAHPTYFTHSHSDVKITVHARYTYGQAVKGKVRIRIANEYCDLGFVHECDAKAYRSKETEILGETTIPVNMIRELQLKANGFREDERNFKIQAIVLEDLTGVEHNATDTITFHQHSIKLEFQPGESFKPGLPFNQKLTVLHQDHSPVHDPDAKVNVKITFFYKDKDPISQSSYHHIPHDGVISIDLDIPHKLTSLNFEATFKDVTTLMAVSKAPVTGNFEYIQLSQLTEKAIVANPIKIEIMSTQAMSNKLILLVVGKQDIVHVKTLPPSESSTQSLQFIIQESMAPLMTIIVYYVTPCGYLVNDALTIQVEGIIRTPISISILPNRTEPGMDVDIEVKTKEQSHVFIMAVDHRLHMQNLGNDITENKILDDMKAYELSDNYFYNPRINVHNTIRSFPWVTPHTPLQVFLECDLLIFQNVVEEYNAPRAQHEYADNREISSDEDVGEIDYSHTKKRTNFPETYLWLDGVSDSKGRFMIKEKSPDFISSFTFTAIVLDKMTGLGVVHAKDELIVTRKFFATFNVPYSVIKDEHINIRVLVYNYYDEKLTAKVTLTSEKKQFGFLYDGHETGEPFKQVTVDIHRRDGVAVDFKIVPKVLGYITLNVSAVCFKNEDNQIKKLLVISEGVTRHQHSVSFIDLRESTTFTASIPIEFPPNVVPDSQAVSFAVTGDLLGLTINNVDQLIYHFPTGCGEQTMLLLAPDVTVTKYLDSIGELKDELKKKFLSYIDQGYQSELTYKRDAGSFSAFGKYDPSGSTWLTAFVVKVLNEAEKVTPIDKGVIGRGLQFLKSVQQRDGSFIEVGNVIHEAMQRNSTAGLSLTAYVCATFLQFESEKDSATVKSAIAFLEHHEPNQFSLYDDILATYALVLGKSSSANKFLRYVESKATKLGPQTFWSIATEVNGQQHKIKSLSIEANSYMILVYKAIDVFDRALPIIRWLISKQQEFGGFESSQDSVLGIEALASFADQFLIAPDAKLIMDVTSHSKQFSVERSNALTLQRADLNPSTTSATISAFGSGFAIAQVSWSYNVIPTAIEIRQSAFTITTKVIIPKIFTKIFRIDVCVAAKQPKDSPSNMIVMEIWLPTGCVVDTNHLPHPTTANQIQRMQTKYGNTKLEVYFYSLKNTCVSVVGIQNFLVTTGKQTSVRVFDYYNPEKFSEAFYSLSAALGDT